MAAAITRRMVDANGLRFAVDECGTGDAVALFLHGFPEASLSWRHQLPALAERGWRAVAPDLRGYGDSSRPVGREAYRIDRLVSDVGALFDALGAERRLLVGHDWGAAIAWASAIAKVRPLDGLVVMNVPHPDVFRRVLASSWRQRARSWYILFFQLPWLPEKAMTAGGAKAVEKAFTGMARNPRAFPREVLDRYRANATRPGAMTAMIDYYRANIRAVSSAPSRARVPLAVPTLMVWGEHDTALGIELTEGYEDLVVDFTLVRLPDASHWVQQDAPEAVNAAMARWMAAKLPERT